jgi:hypothetical protein
MVCAFQRPEQLHTRGQALLDKLPRHGVSLLAAGKRGADLKQIGHLCGATKA